MNNGKKQWFYLNLGQRRGPVSKEKLCELIERKEIYYSDVQVWKEGMKEWLPVSKVRSFAGSIKKVSTPSSSTVDTREAKERELREQDSHLGGLGRFGYNLYFYIGWPIVYMLGFIACKELQLYGVLDSSDPVQLAWVPYIIWGFVGLVTLIATASRMRNAGYAGSWCMGLLVPLLNLWILLISLCGPTNYRRRKRLGMGGLVFFMIFVGVTLGATFVNMGGYHINVDGMKRSVFARYSKLTNIESRQSSALNERAKDNHEKEVRERELEETGREGREMTEREREIDAATSGGSQ
ncbi:protein of unknown function [Rubritalea squalenifaciens DSM 18772]|uniref:GYF domain-containing protein n=1 Tax=Rubritalea squalenifaciens DSM 18772 TaxID=1123071 RepID=A0A1M6P4A9_9BACT|nr:DUF4339 domain-containing protein [Rubritalea squalenifaciens]SHK02758.1 protein of unknown function [Rubritalea squalenifaciens DSM 18772]